MSTLASITNFSSQIPSFAAALERALNPYEDKSLRIPFVLTSTWREKRGIAPLVMRMNPQTVGFSQQKRITERKTQGGTVIYHWTDARGENNDILRVSFNGQTGNINLRTGARKKSEWLAGVADKFGDLLSEGADKASAAIEGALGLEPSGTAQDMSGVSRLANFWNLYSLTAEPVLDILDGTPNVSTIQFTTPLFGNSSIRLEGHFNGVLEIASSADSPFNSSYSFSFTAVSTTPSVSQLYASIVSDLSEIYNNKGLKG